MANSLPKPNLPGQPMVAPAAMPKAAAFPAPPPVAPPPMAPPPGQLPKAPVALAPGLGAQPQLAARQANTAKPIPSAPVAPAPATAGGSAPPPEGDKKTVFAKAKKSPLRFLPIIAGAIILILVIIFAISRFLSGGSNQSVSISQDGGTTQSNGSSTTPAKQTILTYWGLWEDNAMKTVLEDFSKENPGVIVEYEEHRSTEYRERLQSAIASGNGPDVFRFHASWVPMLKAELDIMPSSVMSSSEFRKDFYPAAVEQLAVGSKIYGVPLMYDGLALYYNKQSLDAANIDVPTSWSELKTAASKLTIRSDGKIQRAGVALGTANNVEHFSDVLALLTLQNGASLDRPTSTEAEQALQFYTDFYTKSNVWDETMPNSTVAFARGDVAMMFAPSWRAHEVQAINPNLDFAIVPVPKLTESHVTWANFWAEGVSGESKNRDLAWKLIRYLSSPEVLRKLYSAASTERSFGEIYPRVSMAEDLIDEPYVAAYLEDAPVATSWYLNSMTHDSGLNDKMVSAYEDAVNDMISGLDADEAMAGVASKSAVILRQYNVE